MLVAGVALLGVSAIAQRAAAADVNVIDLSAVTTSTTQATDFNGQGGLAAAVAVGSVVNSNLTASVDNLNNLNDITDSIDQTAANLNLVKAAVETDVTSQVSPVNIQVAAAITGSGSLLGSTSSASALNGNNLHIGTFTVKQ
ncbi:MAG: hypothetical protein P4M11_01310 [Candidatus Pacebacteria bacterium]|nr:hypothetical protein [Candidatus Paceibacterota bacterium]